VFPVRVELLLSVQMVKEAIGTLKERSGSSQQAISKFIGTKHPDLPDNWKKTLSIQLKNLVNSGKLVKEKASYKLGEGLKAPVKPKAEAKPKAAPKPKAAKPAAKPKGAKPAAKPKAAKPAGQEGGCSQEGGAQRRPQKAARQEGQEVVTSMPALRTSLPIMLVSVFQPRP